MRRLVLTLPVLAAGLACTSHDSGATPAPRPETETARRLAIGDELAGHELSRATDGPWSLRTTHTAGSRAEDEVEKKARLDGDVALGVSGGGGGGFRGAGAPAPGAPPPELAAEDGALDAGDVAEARTRRPVDREEDAMAFEPATFADRPADSVATPSVQTLKAGSTDDNADYEQYLEFLATWVDRKNVRDLYQPMDVTDRRFVRVVDVDGRPVPGAVVSIVDEAADRVLFTATTYGDGRVPYYPSIDGEPVTVGAPRSLVIEAIVEDADGTPRGVRAPWDGSGTEVEVTFTGPYALPDPLQLDVCFVIDTTGSMGDEIESIKASLLRVTEKLRGLDREFDLRYSAVLYRDVGDIYVTATHPFTDDIEAFDEALRAVAAGGGGDGPESLNQAVAQAVDGVAWRDDAAKVAFLIADAPPHMDYAGDVPYGEGARAALARGIRFHTVAASGLDPVGTLVFRQIAQLTRGRFIFIEYGSAAASAESHGVAGEVKSDNLEDILFEQLRDEVATYGR